MTERSTRTNDLAELQAELARGALGAELPEAWRGQRLAVYRRLVRANLDECIASILPRTVARSGEAFWALVARFYDEQGPRTHYLRDVPSELIAWWAAQPAVGGLEPHALDLARHEAAAIEVGAALDGAARPAVGELSLERPVVFAEATAVRRYEHAVHLLPEDPGDRSTPEARPCAVLIYRDAEHELRYLDLSPAAACILERLLRGEALQQAIVGGAAGAGVPVDDALLQGAAALLADLAGRGALIGGQA